jgi:hypothetical protein
MIYIICVYVLVARVCLSVISLAADGIVIYLTLTGRNGEAAMALFRDIAARHGGTRRWVVISLIWDIVDPWRIWKAMLPVRR